MPKREVHVIFQGNDPKNLRFVCIYEDYDEADAFSVAALNQLRYELPTRAPFKIVTTRRTYGQCVDLINEQTNTIVATYVIKKYHIM